MSKLLIIGGDTSTGKSTACGKVELPEMGIHIEGLNPNDTFLFNVLQGKPLSSNFMSLNYNKEHKNIMEGNDYDAIKATLEKISNGKKYKNVIIDDFQYLMSLDFFSKKDQTGFTKFAVMGFAVVDLILRLMSKREDLIVYLLTHTDEEVNDGKTKVKLKTIGRMLDEKFKLAGMFTVLIEAYREWDDIEEVPIYGFRLRANSEHSIAKVPIDMFIKDGKHIKNIPNDLAIVEKEIRSNYNI